MVGGGEDGGGGGGGRKGRSMRWQRKRKRWGRTRRRRRRQRGSRNLNLREEVNSIAALLDALLPVLHEVAQGEQGVIAHGDPVFRRPGFHGHQDDAGVELLLVDLVSSKGKSRARIQQIHTTAVNTSWDQTWEVHDMKIISDSVTACGNSVSTHRVGHVHHRFGKVLRLSGRTTELHKLTRSTPCHCFTSISCANYKVCTDWLYLYFNESHTSCSKDKVKENTLEPSALHVPVRGRSPPSARCTWSQSGQCAGLAAPGGGKDTHTATRLSLLS